MGAGWKHGAPSGMPAGGDGAAPKRGGRGKGEPPKGAGPGRPAGVKTGEGKKATFRQLMAPHIEKTAKRWRDIIDDPAHPHNHTMVLKHAELEGEFKQTVEHTGEGGGPVAIEWVIVDPATDRSA